MEIILSSTSGRPIYEQITLQIKEMIMKGDLAPGQALPSMRKLAKDLHVSVITTQRAYDDLQKEGFMSAFPTYTPQADVLRCSEKIITQSAMEFGMPIASSAFSDDTGCHFAEDTNGNMIILDMWKRYR